MNPDEPTAVLSPWPVGWLGVGTFGLGMFGIGGWAAWIWSGRGWDFRTLFGLLLGIPLLFLPQLVPEPAPRWLATEGPAEVLTEGLLFGFLLRAARVKDGWAAIAALLVLGEELDWGQVLLGFDTPAWVHQFESRSDRLNFHNLGWTDALWKPIPVLIILARASFPQFFPEQLRLPRFHSRTGLALLCLLPGLALARSLGDPRTTNELGELALVLWVLLAWVEPSRVRPLSPAGGGAPAG